MTPEWISAISSFITALGVIFVALQVKFAADQLKHSQRELAADHERSRREHAIDVVRRWSDSLDKSLPAARAFIQELSLEQCKCLVLREPFDVSSRHKLLLTHALHEILDSEDDLNIKDDKIHLNQKHLSQLLALAIKHLNGLEVALLSWLNGVADREIIEEQFKYLVRLDDEGHFVLGNLRKAMAGKASFPAIDAFIKHLKDKNDALQPQPKKTIA